MEGGSPPAPLDGDIPVSDDVCCLHRCICCGMTSIGRPWTHVSRPCCWLLHGMESCMASNDKESIALGKRGVDEGFELAAASSAKVSSVVGCCKPFVKLEVGVETAVLTALSPTELNVDGGDTS